MTAFEPPPAVLDEVNSQLGDEADGFLKRFRLEVDEQDLLELDESLQQQFEALGVSKENWLSLKESIRSWIRSERLPATGQIRLEDIRSACGWRQLSPLPQNFEIPNDYTLPLPQFHDRFLERISHGSGSATVLTAGPGIGKSTYLSYLVRALRELGQPVIRHHYALRTGNDRPERLDSRRVAESLMADLQAELRSHLGELGSQNPNPDALNVWLHEVGQRLATDGQHLVVVVDGLDHVWRAEQSRDELRRLFNQLLPVPPGVVLVVGTQPVEDRQLPTSLLEHAPKEHWINLPRLDKQAIREWLSHHRDLMPTGWDQRNYDLHLSELATSLYSRTEGHPLLVRYTVERIAGGGQRLTTNSIEAIPGIPTDSVEDYYRALWVGLPTEARDILFLLAIARLPWPEGGLFECLRLVGYEQASSVTGVAAIRHLLAQDPVGWSPFHNSLLLYARQQPEFAAREPALRKATIEWLREQAPDYWRRSQLWLLQLEAGDARPLIAGSDRRWTVEAVAAGHPLVEVASVLQAAAWEAIDQADFQTYVDRGVLADAVGSSAHQDEALRWLFAAQLSLCTDDFLEPRAIARITELSDSHVLALALHLHGQQRSAEVADCFNEIRRRLNREVDDSLSSSDWQLRYEIVSELAGLVGTEPETFIAFLANFSSEDTKASIADSWAAGQQRSSDVRSAIRLLGEPVSAPVQRCLSRHVAIVGADEGISLSAAERQLLASPYAWVYQAFGGGQLDAALPEEPLPPSSVTEYAFGEYGRSVGRYVHDLFFFLVIRELQSPGFVNAWAPPRGLRPWLASSLKALAQGASDLASGWRDAGSIVVTAGYDVTRSLQNPPWGQGRHGMDDRESSSGMRRALRTVTEDLLVLRRATGGSAKLCWPETETIGSHGLVGFRQILRWIADGTTEIECEAIDGLCASLDDELGATIEPFSERATTFALLATVCARCGFRTKAEHYLRRSSENLIAYGDHKDMLLDIALSAIEAGAEGFETLQPLWRGLAPAIDAVRDFTDGDETSHLPGRLGQLLLCFDPSLAVGYIKSLMDTEHYGDVEGILDNLVRTGDLADPIVNALVSTCIEPHSLRLLEERAMTSDSLAEDLLELSPGFSAYRGERDTGSLAGNDSLRNPAGTRSDSTEPDRYLNTPPERLHQLVRSDSLVWSPFAQAEKLCSWLCCWAETDHAADALEAVEPYFMEDDQLRVSNQAVAAVRRIGGRNRSYKWLVRAQQSNHGWHEYWTSFEETQERWDLVQRDFRDYWHDFLTKSIQPSRGLVPHFGLTIARLVKYLAYFERWPEAYAVASQLLDTVGDLVSGQELPVPGWGSSTSESL